MAKRKRDKAFLAWCHEQGGACCLCGRPFTELHHWGDAGMGQRGSDYVVTRLCHPCHERSGRRNHSLTRNKEADTIAAYHEDNLGLLVDWLEHGLGKTVRKALR